MMFEIRKVSPPSTTPLPLKKKIRKEKKRKKINHLCTSFIAVANNETLFYTAVC